MIEFLYRSVLRIAGMARQWRSHLFLRLPLWILLAAACSACPALATAATGAGDAPTAAAAAAPKPEAKPAPAAHEYIYQGEATSILGREVVGPDGKVVGRIVDVLVGPLGIPRAAVLDVGGFLGLGTRHIALAWRALHFLAQAEGTGRITLDMTIEQIRATPEYKPAGKPVTVAAPPQTDRPPP